MILDAIVGRKRTEVERRKAEVPISELRARLKNTPAIQGFRRRLIAGNDRCGVRRPSHSGGSAGSGDPRTAGNSESGIRNPTFPAVIAEIKKGSPSRGIIRFDFDPAAIAASYEQNGAAALSVLTDAPFFYGCLADLSLARQSCSLPILRKDFTVDEYQVVEARAAGADAILLVAAVLNSEDLRKLLAAAEELGMDALVETHNEREMELALQAGADLVGVNNRDLRTFEVDVSTTARLAKMVPDGVVLVAESGIRTADDLRRLGEMGVRAALIGEALISAPDPGAKLRELLS